jgi:signal transduction histidine kinase
MPRPIPRARSPIWLLAFLVLALAVLATLQYRWIGEVGEAERQRQRSAMEQAARHFGDELDRELGRTFATFQLLPSDDDVVGTLVRRRSDWMATARAPLMLQRIYTLQVIGTNGRPTGLELQSLDAAAKKLVKVEWPPEFQPIRARIEERFIHEVPPENRRFPPVFPSIPAIVAPTRRPGPPSPREQPPPRRGGPSPDERRARQAGGPGGELDERRPPPDGPPGDRPPPPPPRDGGPPPPGGDPGRPPFDGPPPPRPQADRDGQPPSRTGGGEPRRENANATLSNDADRLPAATRPAPRPADGPHDLGSFLVLRLDRNVIARQLLPDLTKRYFTGAADQYDVAVVVGTDVIYRSSRVWPQDARDAKAEVIWPTFILALPSVDREVPPREPNGGPWKLLVRHRGGSVDEIVTGIRQRNLGVAFAVLVVLAGAITALAVLLRRAERLREQQLEFVAGVTHELNTPLAALTAAGQNLADGIVAPDQVERYAGVIVKESRRLAETVAQVLEFAGLQSRRTLPPAMPIDLHRVVDDAVAACRWMADEKGARIETRIEDDLPRIDGDPVALTRAVQNLVGNAIKYGGEKPAIGVGVKSSGDRLTINVIDNGPGIDPHEMRRLFEPFFRGRKSADRVRGNGLGLTIVKQVAMAHGGRVTAANRRECGASFTIELPVGGRKR